MTITYRYIAIYGYNIKYMAITFQYICKQKPQVRININPKSAKIIYFTRGNNLTRHKFIKVLIKKIIGLIGFEGVS